MPPTDPPAAVPWVDNAAVHPGTVIMQPVPEGYECRWYKLPASLPPGITSIPIESLEFIFGGLYGKDRNLIRPIGPFPGVMDREKNTTQDRRA